MRGEKPERGGTRAGDHERVLLRAEAGRLALRGVERVARVLSVARQGVAAAPLAVEVRARVRRVVVSSRSDALLRLGDALGEGQLAELGPQGLVLGLELLGPLREPRGDAPRRRPVAYASPTPGFPRRRGAADAPVPLGDRWPSAARSSSATFRFWSAATRLRRPARRRS